MSVRVNPWSTFDGWHWQTVGISGQSVQHFWAVQVEKKEEKTTVIMITKDTKLLLPSSIFYEHSPFTFHIINHVFNNRIKTNTEATHLRQTGNVRLKSQAAA